MAKVSRKPDPTTAAPAPPSKPAGTSQTQRAYTLRLRPLIGEGDDAETKRRELQDALWATHEAINNGAKAFGEWLLTLRGGLDHSLADAPNGKGQRPTEAERRDRRVMLALSWLTVEDERGAPKDAELIIAYGQECRQKQHGQAERDELVVAALRDILIKRGLTRDEIESWVADCKPSLTARIRGDAVWVNRSEAFDIRVRELSVAQPRAEVWDVLDWVFKSREDYFRIEALLQEPIDPATTTEPQVGAPEAGPAKPKELTKEAGGWLVLRFPKAAGADFSAVLSQYQKFNAWLRRGELVGLPGAEFARRVAGVMGASNATIQALERSFTYSGAKKGSGFFSALTTILQSPRITTGEVYDLVRGVSEAIDRFTNRQAARNSTPRGTRPLSNAILATVAQACGFEYSPSDSAKFHFQYCVMIGMAAERVSAHHSSCKLAEVKRRAFEADAAKVGALTAEHPAAVEFLKAFRESRGRDTGSLGGEPLLIRKRAITGWKDVVTAWSRTACKSADDRVAAMRALQDELEKFGDHTLFERVATEEAKVVWQRPDGSPDHTILSRYVEGTVAQANQQRFKVPAYRHPDPLHAPIFGRFGNSQWKIDFAVRKRVSLAAHSKKLGKNDTAYLANDHNMRLGLWTGHRVENMNLRWSSKRLSADLGLRNLTHDKDAIVTRADRLGRAAADVTGAVNVASIFEEEHWNGRLQAPRAELDRIARLLDKGKVASAAKAKARLSWLVTFSPKLAPAGPFIDYATEQGIPANKKGEYYPNSDINKADKRQGHAKLILSRLPGLRVLSVDLGHRFAAACAVWETMSTETFNRAVTDGAVVSGGSGPDDVFCHVRTKMSDGHARTTIYRRIGADTLPDGTMHPAPWARLDRQFLIKLQGEDESPRKMSPAEVTMLDGWRKALGAAESPAVRKPRNVAEGMADGARLLMLAIRRHADRARIAHNLTATSRTRPGGQTEALDHAGRVHLVAETLSLWHGLFSGERWTDDFARSLWNEAGLPDVALPAPSGGEEGGPAFGGAARRKAQEAFINELRPHAERIVSDDALAKRLSKRWADRWEQDDRVLEHRGHRSGLLRELRRWIAPRGLRTNPEAARAARHVGGLSIDRINTITAAYRLLKAFKNRPEPNDLRKNIPSKGDDRLSRFHQRLLDMRNRLREQRVKQLASRIVEAALGVGRMPRAHIRAGAARPTARVDAPCHAVVIESLTNYRPDELQTRRENRQLMEWSSAKVQKYLKEGCELHGLHLREVQPNYTSRQCSRTGAAGVRCVQVSAAQLLAGWWKKDIDRARDRVEKARKEGRDGAQADRLLVEASQWAERLPDAQRAAHRIVVPKRGGDLFVSMHVAHGKNGHVAALQADLNAAANIGLRALLDPDWPGKWWFVPCTGGTFTPAPEKTLNAAVFARVDQLPHENDSSEAAGAPVGASKGKRRGRGLSSGSAPEKAIENRWRNISAAPLRDDRWVSTAAYWSIVLAEVCRGLRQQLPRH